MFDESGLVIIEPCESTTCTQNLITGNLRRMKLKQELVSALRGCCHIFSLLIYIFLMSVAFVVVTL